MRLRVGYRQGTKSQYLQLPVPVPVPDSRYQSVSVQLYSKLNARCFASASSPSLMRLGREVTELNPKMATSAHFWGKLMDIWE